MQIRCPHGQLVDAVEVTMFGDTRPRYLATPCNCPRPYCPFCQHELDTDGRCHGLPVPLPDIH